MLKPDLPDSDHGSFGDLKEKLSKPFTHWLNFRTCTPFGVQDLGHFFGNYRICDNADQSPITIGFVRFISQCSSVRWGEKESLNNDIQSSRLHEVQHPLKNSQIIITSNHTGIPFGPIFQAKLASCSRSKRLTIIQNRWGFKYLLQKSGVIPFLPDGVFE